MKTSAQLQSVIELLEVITAEKRPADRLLSQFFRSRRYIGSKDKRAIAELTYGVLRQLAVCRWLSEQSGLGKEARSCLIAYLVNHEPEWLNCFGDSKYAPEELSEQEQKAINKIGTLLIQDAPQHVSLNLPEWLLSVMHESLGDQLEPELAALQNRAPLDVRVNTLKAELETVQNQLEKNGYELQLLEFSPWGLSFGVDQKVAINQLESFKNGLFEVQDQGSQLIALATQVKPGNKVVDFCAGAGGKTLAMAAQMQNKGVIHACDVHSKRLKNLSTRQKRAGVHNIQTHLLSSENDKWVKRQQGKMDVVLIDAPCSGTGTWRRSPDARWNLTQQQLDNLIVLQQNILNSASRLVRPGGRLIYATCSLLKEENEGQITQFLAQNEQFKTALLPEVIRQSGLNVVNDFQLRTYPSKDNMDGFFVGVLEREIG